MGHPVTTIVVDRNKIFKIFDRSARAAESGVSNT
jgi:hypothetical protein